MLQVINFCARGSSIPAQRTILEDDLEETTTCARVVCDADNILQLLGTACRHPFCQEKISVKQTYVGGTLCLQWHCRNRHEGSWSSSKRCKGRKSYLFFTNDLLFASSIVLSCNQFAKIELMCRFLGLKFQSQSTFYRIQRLYICPSVFELWSETRETNLGDIANCPVVLAVVGWSVSAHYDLDMWLSNILPFDTLILLAADVLSCSSCTHVPTPSTFAPPRRIWVGGCSKRVISHSVLVLNIRIHSGKIKRSSTMTQETGQRSLQLFYCQPSHESLQRTHVIPIIIARY